MAEVTLTNSAVFVRTRFLRRQNYTTPPSPTNTLLDEGDSDVMEHTFRHSSPTSTFSNQHSFHLRDTLRPTIRFHRLHAPCDPTSATLSTPVSKKNLSQRDPLRHLYLNLYRISFLPQLVLLCICRFLRTCASHLITACCIEAFFLRDAYT